MYMGYEFSTKSGSSIGIDDFVIPDDKQRIVSEAEKEVKDIESQFASGLVTKGAVSYTHLTLPTIYSV